MLLSPTGTVTDTYTYWPYGEIQNHTGSSTTPFTFVGTLGYYLDLLGSLIYVRARHLRQALARWQTVDPLWPWQWPYLYTADRPTSHVDPAGSQARTDLGSGYPSWGKGTSAVTFTCGTKVPKVSWLLRCIPFFDIEGWEETAQKKYCATCLALCLTDCATEDLICDIVCQYRFYLCQAQDFPPYF